MESTDVDIDIRTNGGDEAASEIGKAAKAIDNTTESSARLQGRFQERFQHIGLMP